MSIIIETRATADAQGGLRVELPRATVQPNATVQLRLEISEAEQAMGRFSKRFATREEYLAAIERVSGRCKDLTFVPPEDQSLEDIEAL